MKELFAIATVDESNIDMSLSGSWNGLYLSVLHCGSRPNNTNNDNKTGDGEEQMNRERTEEMTVCHLTVSLGVLPAARESPSVGGGSF